MSQKMARKIHDEFCATQARFKVFGTKSCICAVDLLGADDAILRLVVIVRSREMACAGCGLERKVGIRFSTIKMCI